MMGKIINSKFIEPVYWVVGFLILWECLVELNDISSLILAAPTDILIRIVTDAETIASHSLKTSKLILFGFLAGAIPGIVLGYLVSSFRICRETIYPVAVFIQGLPKITLAPLLLIWFGFSDFPIILLTAMITFFPVMVDSALGIDGVDKRLYYIARSAGASRLAIFRHIQLFCAAPAIFSGMKITVVICVTVVIVVEWLNANSGLGYLVLRAMDASDTSLIFAVLIIGSLIGLLFLYVIQLAELFFSRQGGEVKTRR